MTTSEPKNEVSKRTLVGITKNKREKRKHELRANLHGVEWGSLAQQGTGAKP